MRLRCVLLQAALLKGVLALTSSHLDLLRVGFFGVASLRQFDDAVALLATFSRRFVPKGWVFGSNRL